MQKAIIIYVIIQLVSTAYGLAVIESIRPIVEKKLREQGYKKNRNSLYNFNNTMINVAKSLIPFYYLTKAINIISDKSSVDKKVNEEIKSGNYIIENEYNNDIDTKKNEEVEEVEIVGEEVDSIYKSKDDLMFEKPEKYTAKKNDISLYDTYETPIDYIERVSKKEDELELTPFVSSNKVVEHVVVKEEVSKADIAKALSELSVNELDLLKNKIDELAQLKREKDFKLKLEKEVA